MIEVSEGFNHFLQKTLHLVNFTFTFQVYGRYSCGKEIKDKINGSN
jgi:hypothetical protein